MRRIRYYWDNKPLEFILVLSFLTRLVSVVFSKGYGMHDDHFLVVESAQAWIDGDTEFQWLPSESSTGSPSGHSWFYVGLHYYLFQFLDIIGLNAPQGKMYVVRLIHALWYLLAIKFAYKTVLKLSTSETAKWVGLFIGVLWFTPIMSVRNLVEVVCLTPLLGATYYLIKEERLAWKHIFAAGMLLGVAVAVRFQTVLFVGGIGLVLLSKNVMKAFGLGVFFAISLFLTQIADLYFWGQPFAEFSEYIAYNFANKTTYFSRPWYMYFGTISGLLLPPFSVFLFIGLSKVFKKKYLLLVVPSLIFFGFHCYFPNKQERFIIPFIPYFMMLGWIGWSELLESGGVHIHKWNKYGMRFFWGLNTVLLLAITPAYTKKSRVEVMEFVGGEEGYSGLIAEQSIEYEVPLMPRFYSDHWTKHYDLAKGDDVAALVQRYTHPTNNKRPSHIAFFQPDELDERKKKVEVNCGCELVEKAVIEPSYLDKFVHWLNPVNDNEMAFVYELNYFDK